MQMYLNLVSVHEFRERILDIFIPAGDIFVCSGISWFLERLGYRTKNNKTSRLIQIIIWHGNKKNVITFFDLFC